jgi:hypothetical protein
VALPDGLVADLEWMDWFRAVSDVHWLGKDILCESGGRDEYYRMKVPYTHQQVWAYVSKSTC